MKVTLEGARRLAVRASLLSGLRPASDGDGILEVARTLGSLQIDPTRTVEKTHLLVLWSRLGAYDRSELDRLLWQDRRLFEQQAFIFPRESLGERRFFMEHGGKVAGAWHERMRRWVAENERWRRALLERLESEGPLPSRAFSGAGLTHWPSSGWTDGRNVTQLLEWMGARGEVMVAGRRGAERLWHLPERVLEEFPSVATPAPAEFARLRVENAVRRLGVATLREIQDRIPFVGRPAARAAVEAATAEGVLVPVAVELDGMDELTYVHRDAVPSLDGPALGPPRTTLLSPFDPLIKDRDRTERLFGFRYRLEMYVPKAQRKYGHFVLPILHGDALIGRVSPRIDRRTGVLHIEGVHAEPDAPMTRAVGRSLRAALDDLARWLGAREITVADGVPRWAAGLGSATGV